MGLFNHQVKVSGRWMERWHVYLLTPLIDLFFIIIPQQPMLFAYLFLNYAFFPALDAIIQLDQQNPTQSQIKYLTQNHTLFQFSLYAQIAVDWLTLYKFLNILSVMPITLGYALRWFAYFLTLGGIASTSFVVSHEIFHKLDNFRKILGTLNLSKVFYMHFYTQHIYGHHRNVSTPNDPATSKKGQTVFQFFPKTVKGSWLSAYNIEKTQHNKSIFTNLAVLSIIISILFCGVIFYFYSFQGLAVFIIQGIIAIYFLELINYVQHYGLRRKVLPNGEYQKVNIMHSWNAAHRYTNYLLWKLQRHSDHHENSLKPYQILQTHKQSPTFPNGYGAMIFLASSSNIWFKVMDPLVEIQQNPVDDQSRNKIYAKSQDIVNKFIIKMGTIATFFFAISPWL